MRLRLRPDLSHDIAARHAAARGLLLVCFSALFITAAGAQPGPSQQPQQTSTPPPQHEGAPPPLKFIPSDLRARLAAEDKDMKDRTKLSIQLAGERLTSAEAHTAADKFDAAGLDLGVYQALIADAVRFIKQSGRNDNKARDNFKRIDLALREHTTRIEKIRRQTPATSAVHVKAALDFVRDLRTAALESFYGDTVLREPPVAHEQKSPEKKP